MKRILLVCPPRGTDGPSHEDSSVARTLGFPRGLMPPLDLATIAALTPPEVEVDIWDESIRGLIDEKTDLGAGYDLIGVTGYMTQIPRAMALAEVSRRRGIPAVIGGPGASGAPERCRGLFDTVFIGEAELTWPQFIRDWRNGRPRSEYRQVQRPDINDSPQPSWRGMGNMAQDYLMGAVQTTRGCPFDCEFCDVIHLFGRQPRHKAIETVLEEVATMQRLGMRLVFFCDDNFIGRPKYARDLLKALIPLNNSFERPLGFTTQLTINLAEDDELLELMADANFVLVRIGIESPREACLREANKPQNYKVNMIDAVRKIQSYGMFVKGNMIVGFDHDDAAVFDEIYDFLRESCLLTCVISILKAYPGTPLLTRLQRDGRIIDIGDDVYADVSRSFRTQWTNIIPKQMSRVELFEGYRRLMERIHSWDHFAMCMKETLRGIKRQPKVPRRFQPDPQRIEMVRRGIQMLEPKAQAIVVDLLQTTQAVAPFMLEKVVATLFRFGGSMLGLHPILESLDRRLAIESAPDFTPNVVRTLPSVPEGFKNQMHWEAFPKSYHWLMEGMHDKTLVAEGLIQVWKSFLIRWATSFESFEDYHFEHLRELCERTIEQANTGQLSGDRVNAVVDGLSGTQLRRLAGEVLVSVEQDLRGVGAAPTVELNVG